MYKNEYSSSKSKTLTKTVSVAVTDVRRGTCAVVGARRVVAHRRIPEARAFTVIRCALVDICQGMYVVIIESNIQ